MNLESAHVCCFPHRDLCPGARLPLWAGAALKHHVVFPKVIRDRHKEEIFP